MIAAYQRFYGVRTSTRSATARFFRRFLAPSEDGLLLGARIEGELAGYACLYWHFSSTRATESVLMNDLYVDPNRRGGGIGRALIDASLAVARERGASHLEWETAPDNATAQRLYDATGAEARPGSPTARGLSISCSGPSGPARTRDRGGRRAGEARSGGGTRWCGRCRSSPPGRAALRCELARRGAPARASAGARRSSCAVRPAVDEDEVAVSSAVEARAEDAPAAGRNEPRPAGRDHVEALVDAAALAGGAEPAEVTGAVGRPHGEDVAQEAHPPGAAEAAAGRPDQDPVAAVLGGPPAAGAPAARPERGSGRDGGGGRSGARPARCPP